MIHVSMRKALTDMSKVVIGGTLRPRSETVPLQNTGH